MAMTHSERMAQIAQQSADRLRQEEERAKNQRNQQAQKQEDSKALAAHKADLTAANNAKKAEFDTANRAELAKLEVALTPEQLGHQYDHYVKINNIDLQAFTQRENTLAFLQAQADDRHHEHRRQDLITALKGYLVEDELREQAEESRHQREMERARLEAELEVRIFQEKHQFLHELYAKSNEADRKRMTELFKEFELDQPYEPKGHDQPDEPQEPE